MPLILSFYVSPSSPSLSLSSHRKSQEIVAGVTILSSAVTLEVVPEILRDSHGSFFVTAPRWRAAKLASPPRDFASEEPPS
ncbi:hypothetical protein L484_027076 [Morus notabilis]|uniref:Uncharacterized protein n=1 Tax=Morus notabilis TaxID=981085 RepID=W9SBG8_9ROSA|nr:hypothetical protein L484_027076 [Morus notabilis]